jgi:hypothetical protein
VRETVALFETHVKELAKAEKNIKRLMQNIINDIVSVKALFEEILRTAFSIFAIMIFGHLISEEYSYLLMSERSV